MAIKSYSLGHEIIFHNNQWVYNDTLKPLTSPRECKRCGNFPTPGGHDSCLGKIEGVVSACCGHGIEPAFFIFE